MKKIVLTLIGIVLMIISLSITNRFTFWGVHLDLMLVYAVSLAMHIDSKTDYITISILGIMYDLTISPFLGVATVLLLGITALTRFVLDKLYEEKFWSPALLFMLASIISVVYYFGINTIFFIPKGLDVLWTVLWKKVILNMAVGLLLNLILKPLFNRIMKNWW